MRKKKGKKKLLPIGNKMFDFCFQRGLNFKDFILKSQSFNVSGISLEGECSQGQAVHVIPQDKKNGEQLIQTRPVLWVHIVSLRKEKNK